MLEVETRVRTIAYGSSKLDEYWLIYTVTSDKDNFPIIGESNNLEIITAREE